MMKRLLTIVVLALAGLISACSSPSSPGASPIDGGETPALESPGESPAESMEASPSAS